MKRTAALRTAIAELWSADAPTRAAAAERLNAMASDLVDIRTAQPALTWAMSDPDPAVRLAAVRATHERVMGGGADVRLAVPALIELAADPDVEVRWFVWATLDLANDRGNFLAQLPAVVKRGRADPDPNVARITKRL
ncbi:MAG: hypothetical protein ABI867_14510 [Kofleriaceae bacterium]